MREIQKQDGIAVILALIMLLVMSIMALTITFNSNVEFQAMTNYKSGQQSFLAAERCVQWVREQLEITGVELLFFELQNNNLPGARLMVGTNCDADAAECAVCRTGQREYQNPTPGSISNGECFDNNSEDTVPFLEIPPPSKTVGRPLKHTSLPSGGAGGASMVGVDFVVTGKDIEDEDKCDISPDLNTGTEIAGGFETFVPGGASNVY